MRCDSQSLHNMLSLWTHPPLFSLVVIFQYKSFALLFSTRRWYFYWQTGDLLGEQQTDRVCSLQNFIYVKISLKYELKKKWFLRSSFLGWKVSFLSTSEHPCFSLLLNGPSSSVDTCIRHLIHASFMSHYARYQNKANVDTTHTYTHNTHNTTHTTHTTHTHTHTEHIAKQNPQAIIRRLSCAWEIVKGSGTNSCPLLR